MTGRIRTGLFAAALIAGLMPWPTRAAVKYPLTLTLDAELKSGVTTITTKVTIHVEKPMTDSWRTQVTDALKHGGYSNFVGALRPLPAVGSIETQRGKVEIRYTREDADSAGGKLILVADRPLFFLSNNAEKPKVGFDLTLVELRFDGKGGVMGPLAGAARVRPAPDGTVLLDTYAEELVQLKGRIGGPPSTVR